MGVCTLQDDSLLTSMTQSQLVEEVAESNEEKDHIEPQMVEVFRSNLTQLSAGLDVVGVS